MIFAAVPGRHPAPFADNEEMDRLDIWTLDGLRFAVGETPLPPFKTRKTTALLVYLGCERRPHARDHLMHLLWADSPPKRAANNLSIALSALRKAVGPYLQSDRHSVGIAPDAPLWVDAHALATALSPGETEPRLDRVTSRKWRAAVELYQSDFLAGFHVRNAPVFEEWALVERERLARIVAERLFQLATHDLAQGQIATGLQLANRLAELDPFNERAHRLLMRLHAANGQPAQAQAQFERSRRLLESELGVEPDTRSQMLLAQIRDGRYTPPTPSHPPAGHNIPPAATPFIGRADDIAAIVDRLTRPDCRLLTVTGAGGQGKTRLVREVGVALADRFAAGVCFVPLEGLTAAANIPGAILDALRVTAVGSDEPRRRLLDFLAERELLLILDNFEHLLAGAALLEEIVGRSPGVKCLVTSRERLNLQAEWLYPLAGLPLPTDGNDDVTAYAAGELFADRAARLAPAFAPEEEGRAVARICRLVDGSPLAIELAAAWTRLYSGRQIVAAIEDGLSLLSTRNRDVPARHRSMTAVFDHSWRLLTAPEQAILARLAVFHNGFSTTAAGVVADADVATLASLMEKSLIRRAGPERLDLHPLLRQYAAGRLAADAGEESRTSAAHATFFAALVEREGVALRGPRPRQAMTIFTQEVDNIRAAWEWAVRSGRPDILVTMTPGLTRYLRTTSRLHDGQELYRFALATLPSDTLSAHPVLAARLHLSLAHFLESSAAYDKAGDAFARAREILEAIPEPDMAAQAAMADVSLGTGYFYTDSRNDYETAATYYRRAKALYTRLGDRRGIAEVLTDQAMLFYFRGQNESVRPLYTRALALYRQLDDVTGVAETEKLLGMYYAQIGDFPAAIARFGAAESLQREHASPIALANTRYNRSICHAFAGQFDQALALLEEALSVYKQQSFAHEIGHVESVISYALVHLGQFTPAQLRSELTLAHSEALDYPRGQALDTLFLAMAAQGRDQLAEAEAWGERSVAHYAAIGLRDEWLSALAIHTLTAVLDDRLAAATGRLRQALELAATIDTFHCRVECLAVAALYAHRRGDTAVAAHLWSPLATLPFVANSRWFAHTIARHLPPPEEPADAADLQTLLEVAEEQLT